jgi:uncharacterized protein (TIGR03643 family)
MSEEYAPEFINRIIRLAWADEVSFDKIKREHGLSEAEVIKIMRRALKPGSFRLWRKRVSGRKSKHEKRARYLEQKSR